MPILILLRPAVIGGVTQNLPQRSADHLAARRTPVVEVSQANRDAVVNISNTQLVSVRPDHGAFDSLLFDLLDQPRQVKATSLGSGVVIHSHGYIVTNAHVVSRTVERKVSFADGTSNDARIGRSDDLMVGETVVAIGNPFGFRHTVTSGVISAVGRDIDVRQGVVFHDSFRPTPASIPATRAARS